MTRIRRSSGFLATSLGSAALSACAVFLLLAARPIGAGPGMPPKHAALSNEVSVDGELVQEDRGWLVRIRALNTRATERRCRITASLTRTRVNPMARALPMPQTVWSSTVALTVPPSRASDQKLPIPAEVAAQIRAPQDPQKAPPLEIQESFGVRVQASCGETDRDSVS